MLQTPILFGFIISWILHNSTVVSLTLNQGMQLCASGLAFALGILGPVIGLAIFATSACSAMGFNRHAHETLFSFTFISQTIIETPILFVLIVALILCFNPTSSAQHAGIVYIISALCMGMTTLPVGISSGKTAEAACNEVAHNLSSYNFISSTSLLGQVFIETNTIYGLIVVLTMIFTLP